MYNPIRVRQSEIFQLLLLDILYAQSGSEDVIFQGGTALRWIYGGGRFSEDLDFVVCPPLSRIQGLLSRIEGKLGAGCIAQFGPGTLEQKHKSSRPSALKRFFVYRPSHQRERIAVRLEFEGLKPGCRPQSGPHVLRELPQVSGLITGGHLFLPYSSSIVLAETVEEILSDKIRALFERAFIKGRDVFDYWWITTQLQAHVHWPVLQRKLAMYEAPFIAARDPDFFQTPKGQAAVREALDADLPRFIQPNLFSLHQQEGFERLMEPLGKLPVDRIREAFA